MYVPPTKVFESYLCHRIFFTISQTFFGLRPLVPLLLHVPPFFTIIIFLSTTLLTRMTSVCLHMQWPLTSQPHGSFLKENNWFFVTYETPHALIQLGVSPPSLVIPQTYIVWTLIALTCLKGLSGAELLPPSDSRVSLNNARKFRDFLPPILLTDKLCARFFQTKVSDC
jgi:hypothetical protein